MCSIENIDIFPENAKGKDLVLDCTEKKLTGLASKDKPWMKFHSEKAKNAMMPNMTIYDYLWERNKDRLDRVALNYYGRLITYKELFDNINKSAEIFQNLGVKKGDIVTISMPTTPDTVYMFYALSMIGATANMIDPRKSAKEMEEYANEANSKLFVIIDSYVDKVKDIKNNSTVEDVIVSSAADSLPPFMKKAYNIKNFSNLIKAKKYYKWKDLLENAIGKGVVKAPYDEKAPVAIVHTGGTTGTPKGVMLSNLNLNASALQCELCGLDFKRGDKWLNIMPPFIAYGVGNGLHLPLTMGMQVTLVPAFDPRKFGDYLMKEKPNHLTGVPSHYGHLMGNKKIKPGDLYFLKSPIVGGDAMNKELEVKVNEFLKKSGCDSTVIKGYGLSEYAAASNVSTHVDGTNAIGSVGIPFANTIVRIVDPTTREELPYGKGLTGEVEIKGPNTMLGYYENEKSTNDMIDSEGWIHTGDIGYMDENGRLYIMDRIKRVIIRADGFKVFPSKIESAVNSCEVVENCVAVATPDKSEAQGNLPALHIVLKEQYKNDQASALEKIKKVCKEKLAEYEQPVKFKFDDKLPLTSIGKIDAFKVQGEETEENSSSNSMVRIRK